MSSPTLNPDLSRAWALEAGFTESGLIALPHQEASRDADRFEAWVAAGHAGTMGYLERRGVDGKLLRARVATPFPWARSAIVCFASYQSAQPLSIQPSAQDTGWIARYSWSSKTDKQGQRRPSDYHKVLKRRLEALEFRLRAEILVSFQARAFVDTGPVVERSLAVAAGLGWTGKNTCLIHPKLGSFGFLAVLLTSLETTPKPGTTELPHPDRCGTCRRCIEACPTNALIEPYKMDATRCISYLTIEHKGPIAEELMPGIGRQVFGCDICQDVCPWNAKALRNSPAAPSAVAPDPELEPRPELINPTLEWLASLDESAFEQQFNGSPLRRAGFNGLRRNIAIAMANSGLQRFAPLLTAWAESADEGLRTAARWALERLQSP